MTDVRSRLFECFKAVFPDLGEVEIPRASMASLGSWDSVASVNLVAVIEEEFDLQLPPEDLVEFVSFELILDRLRSSEDAS